MTIVAKSPSVERGAAVRGPWARLALRWVRDIRYGEITLVFPNGAQHNVRGREPGPAATVIMHRIRTVRRMLTRGDVGFAEGFMDGDWSTPDLLAVLAFGYRNEATLAGALRASALVRPMIRLWHRLRANTRAGSRRNVAYHYDLGNAFYRLWLDETMTYSSAIFDRPDRTLAAAQTEKNRRIIRALDLKPTDHVLEIGCGWGGFAELAALESGCRVTGLTLSREQAAFARQRLADKGLGGRVEIRLEDYRDVEGTFDKIVSIEMFEAVGEENWAVYFRTVHDRLRAGGRAVLQIITVADARFETYRRSIDFIQRYIFPGGMLPSKATLARDIAAAGLSLAGSSFFGLSYAETLRRWHETFEARWAEIAPLGFDDRFRQMWRYYLCGCEASFRAGTSDVGQYVIDRR